MSRRFAGFVAGAGGGDGGFVASVEEVEDAVEAGEVAATRASLPQNTTARWPALRVRPSKGGRAWSAPVRVRW
jgi:hypothetical protein